MEIFLAESLGFCMGVKRAVDMAYRALETAQGLPVVTLGPLIHNEQETARLAADGVTRNLFSLGDRFAFSLSPVQVNGSDDMR
jgi:4-hydroxy-3-methylbut-2-enyl diphosphate reductase IspH